MIRPNTRLIYCLEQVYRRCRGCPYALAVALIRQFHPRVCFSGITIIDIKSETRFSDYFLEKATAALRLISKVDPRRFKIVTSQVHVVVNLSLSKTAEYSRLGRLCTVDISKWPFMDKQSWSVRDLACTIVHEATHGRFCARMIPYTQQTRTRIERACVIESMRFARKLGDDSFDWGAYFEVELARLNSQKS